MEIYFYFNNEINKLIAVLLMNKNTFYSGTYVTGRAP